MTAFIYSSSRKNGFYVYLAEKDVFNAIPESIKTALGTLTFVMTLELSPNQKLASENPVQVMQNLSANGFHLQISDPVRTTEKLRKLSEQ